MPGCGHSFFSPKDTAVWNFMNVEKAIFIYEERADALFKRTEDAAMFAMANAPLFWRMEGRAYLTRLLNVHESKYIRNRQPAVEFVQQILDARRAQMAAEAQTANGDQQMAAEPVDAAAASQPAEQGMEGWINIQEATSLDEPMA